MAQNIESEIKELGGLDLGGLRSKWKELFDQNPPEFRSPDIFRRMLAARIQERAFGGLSPDAKAKLKKLAKSFGRNRGPRPDLKSWICSRPRVEGSHPQGPGPARWVRVRVSPL